jgi:alpha-tubulin suppressor-like RCC1 family protein
VACGGDDCDDEDERRFPGNSEVCDADDLDEDCNPSTVGALDADTDGYDADVCCNRQADDSLLCGEDCDDSRRSVNPNATEVCDTLDNNCNVTIDEGVILTCFVDSDGDGYALADAASVEACECPTRTTSRPPSDAQDCDDTRATVSPEVPEICSNSRDDDCDDMTDEAGNDWYPDCDGDGAGTGTPVRQCTSPGTPVGCPGGGHVLISGDCDDGNPFTYPGAPERCDNLANNCNNSTVDGSTATTWCNVAMPQPQATLSCSSGFCVVDDCNTNFGDCTGAPGCETDTRTSSAHCGMCNHACDADSWCVASECAAIPFTQLSAGNQFICALRADGRVFCWGNNASGQLGNDDIATTHRSTAAQVTGLTDAVEIAAGWEHACARRQSGAVVCWGRNSYGQVGDGTDSQRLVPTAVLGVAGALEVTAGREHTCARLASSVLCWGRNSYGQLGNSEYSFSATSTATTVTGLTDAVEIDAGDAHTCARRQGGTLVCWGDNAYGKLADGTTGSRSEPAPVLNLTDAIDLAVGGNHTCVRRSAAATVCWGPNFYGEVGDGTADFRQSPTVVIDLGAVTALAAGGYHTCARRASGSAACWGFNESGQLGDTSAMSRTAPVDVSTLTNVVELVAGSDFSCARLTTGGLMCWGANYEGQLGNSTTTGIATFPEPVTGL